MKEKKETKIMQLNCPLKYVIRTELNFIWLKILLKEKKKKQLRNPFVTGTKKHRISISQTIGEGKDFLIFTHSEFLSYLNMGEPQN